MPAKTTPHKKKLRKLAYASQISKAFRLVEVDEDVLKEVYRTGVVLKGSQDSQAVLCTECATYALKQVETTNTILLAQNLQASGADQPIHITATASSQVEILRTAPRLDVLDAILSERPHAEAGADMRADGSAGQGSERGSGHNWAYLLDNTQASGLELRQALEERGAFEDDGKWSLLEPTFLSTVMDLVLLTAASESWPLTALPGDSIIAALQSEDYSPQVIRHCIAQYGHPAPSTHIDDDIWAMDERKVCLHVADKVFAQQARWPLQPFLQAWREAAPEGMTPLQDMLAGEALIEESGGEQIVRRLSVKQLPKDASARFAELFAIRPRWCMQDLQPYLEGLQGPGQSVEALLIQYCRVSQLSPHLPAEYSARY